MSSGNSGGSITGSVEPELIERQEIGLAKSRGHFRADVPL